MKKITARNLQFIECATYILNSERQDFIEWLTFGNECVPYNHIYSSAYMALYGKESFDKEVEAILSNGEAA